MSPLPPLFVSPALPTELLRYVIHHCVYPTTLIVCSSKEDFLSSLSHDISNPPVQEQEERLHSDSAPELLSAALQQVGVARHIQTVFIPTVSHLRAYLAVFATGEHKVPPPPPTPSDKHTQPRLVIYGFLDMHHGSSEWSAQGLSSTMAILLETASDLGFEAVLIEPRMSGENPASHLGRLAEPLPVLTGSAGRTGPGLDTEMRRGRTVTAQRVLARWVQFKEVSWKR